MQYFNKIVNLSDCSFVDQKPATAPTHRLTIEGNNMMQKVEIAGYFSDINNFVVESNQNPDTWFNGKGTDEKLFVPMKSLVK